MGGHLAVDASESERKDLLSELDMMKHLEPHLHVIKLLGRVTISGEYGKVYINSPFSSKSLAH